MSPRVCRGPPILRAGRGALRSSTGAAWHGRSQGVGRPAGRGRPAVNGRGVFEPYARVWALGDVGNRFAAWRILASCLGSSYTDPLLHRNYIVPCWHISPRMSYPTTHINSA